MADKLPDAGGRLFRVFSSSAVAASQRQEFADG